MVQTLTPLDIFAQPMERAEALHTPRYTAEDRWKSIPIKNDRVESRAISTFPRKFYTLFTAGGLSILPGAP